MTEVVRLSAGRYTCAVVAGGRYFSPTDLSREDLDPALDGVALVVEGEATGFDSWIRDMALASHIAVQPVPAFWGLAEFLGRPVGPEGHIRNARALAWARELSAEYGLDLVLIAGPGGRGTAGMRKLCKGLEVREVRG